MCRIKSLKSIYQFYFSFILEFIVFFKKKRLHDTKTFQQWEEGKIRKKKKEEEKGKDKKKID